MKKTDGITKYEMQWQLIRSSIKGQGTDLESKIQEAYSYFAETHSYDRWERVYNWLEGLQKGYAAAKNLVAINRIKQELESYAYLKETGMVKFYDSYELDVEAQAKRLAQASDKAVIVLWKDLFRTNEKWLKKGYYHKECNEFMDMLWQARGIDVSDRFSMKHLQELRGLCGDMDNKHKFFF